MTKLMVLAPSEKLATNYFRSKGIHKNNYTYVRTMLDILGKEPGFYIKVPGTDASNVDPRLEEMLLTRGYIKLTVLDKE